MLWRAQRQQQVGTGVTFSYLRHGQQLLPQLFPTLRLTPNAPLIGPRFDLTSPGLAPRETPESHQDCSKQSSSPRTIPNSPLRPARPAACFLSPPFRTSSFCLCHPTTTEVWKQRSVEKHVFLSRRLHPGIPPALLLRLRRCSDPTGLLSRLRLPKGLPQPAATTMRPQVAVNRQR